MSHQIHELATNWIRSRKTRVLDELFRFLISQAEPESIDLLVEAFEDEEAEEKLGSLLDFLVSALARRSSVASALDIRLADHPQIREAIERAGQRVAEHPEEVEELRTQTEDFLGPEGWEMRTRRLRREWKSLVTGQSSEAAAVRYLWHQWSGIPDDHEEHEARITDLVKQDAERGFDVVRALLSHSEAGGLRDLVAQGPLARLLQTWPEETLERFEDGRGHEFLEALDDLGRGDFNQKTWDRIRRLRRP